MYFYETTLYRRECVWIAQMTNTQIYFIWNKQNACKLPTNLITEQKQIGKGYPSASAFIGGQEETTRVIFFLFKLNFP